MGWERHTAPALEEPGSAVACGEAVGGAVAAGPLVSQPGPAVVGGGAGQAQAGGLISIWEAFGRPEPSGDKAGAGGRVPLMEMPPGCPVPASEVASALKGLPLSAPEATALLKQLQSPRLRPEAKRRKLARAPPSSPGETWTVECIVHALDADRVVVKWKGWPMEANTVETVASIKGALGEEQFPVDLKAMREKKYPAQKLFVDWATKLVKRGGKATTHPPPRTSRSHTCSQQASLLQLPQLGSFLNSL